MVPGARCLCLQGLVGDIIAERRAAGVPEDAKDLMAFLLRAQQGQQHQQQQPDQVR